jgi:hypothetical protein
MNNNPHLTVGVFNLKGVGGIKTSHHMIDKLQTLLTNRGGIIIIRNKQQIRL